MFFPERRDVEKRITTQEVQAINFRGAEFCEPRASTPRKPRSHAYEAIRVGCRVNAGVDEALDLDLDVLACKGVLIVAITIVGSDLRAAEMVWAGPAWRPRCWRGRCARGADAQPRLHRAGQPRAGRRLSGGWRQGA